MKCVIAIMAAVVVASASPAFAQATPATASPGKPLAEVAKEEEARRKNVKKPAKVFTNSSLTADISKGVAPPPSTPATPTTPANTTPGNTTPGAPGATPAPAQGQAYWSGRMAAARQALDRTQIFADSLQSRINALYTDFVNRDDPAQRAKIEGDRKIALAELERVKKELEEQTKAIKAIEDEARRAGVPAGWLRPGA
jgi:hypothetical protein